MEQLAYRLAELSRRERLLLLALAGLALPLAVAVLVLMPVLEARDAARRAVAEAEALRGWVAARVAELPPDGLSEAVAAPPPIGPSGLEQSLIGFGLRDRVAQLSNRPEGGVDLAFDAVVFDDLTAWLAAVAPDWGYRVAAFRLEADSPGRVRASFALEPGP